MAQSNNEGEGVNLTLSAADSDGDPLVYSAVGLPDELSINSGSGVISGTLSFSSAGSHSVDVSVSDGIALDHATFVWTVANVNRPPTLTNPGDQSNSEGESINLALSATDPDGDPLAYSAVGLPDGLSISSGSGVISGTLSLVSAGSHHVDLTVSDGTASDSVSFVWAVGGANQPPTLTNPGAQNNSEGESVNLALSATDPDGDALTYHAVGLPDGLSINSGSGLIAGTLSFASAGSHNVDLSVSDGTASDSVSIVWTVTGVNRSPALTNPGDQNSSEGESINLALSATDPDGDALTYSAVGLPDGLSINSGSGLLSGTLSFVSAGSYNVDVLVSDGSATDSASFVWTVSEANQSPVLTNPGDQTNSEGESVNLSVNAADPDGDALTYSALGLPDGLSINSGSGLISGTLSLTSAGSHSVDITVSDGTASDSVSFVWTVAGVNQSPTLTNPGAQNNSEGDGVNLSVSATDPDGDALTYSALGLPDGLSINSNSGLISGTLSFVSAGSHNVELAVSGWYSLR